MKMQSHLVAIGDRFMKVGPPFRPVYMVKSVVDLYEIPPHVRLVANGQNDEMLMSVSALLDRRLWSRVAAPPLEEALPPVNARSSERARRLQFDDPQTEGIDQRSA